MFDVKHGSGTGPGVFVVVELRSGFETAVTGGVEGLGDGRVFHHDTAVKRRTATKNKI
jgi:hypothetical protein